MIVRVYIIIYVHLLILVKLQRTTSSLYEEPLSDLGPADVLWHVLQQQGVALVLRDGVLAELDQPHLPKQPVDALEPANLECLEVLTDQFHVVVH